MGFGLSTGWLLCLVTKSLTQNLLKEFMFHNYMQMLQEFRYSLNVSVQLELTENNLAPISVEYLQSSRCTIIVWDNLV